MTNILNFDKLENMKILVQKYGGSSVANPERILNIAKRVIEAKRKGHKVVVVVSAMGDTTDELINLAKQVSPFLPQREMDMLLSTGEQQSIALLAMAIQRYGEDAISFTGYQVGILTDGIHGKAKILKINKDKILKELSKDKVVVVAGFQGIDGEGEITTLGRGGSDTTAVALAVALNAVKCEIYTDVEGVYTTDPRIEPNAKKLKTITYDEMLELASLGAKVLHPRSVEIAKEYDVSLEVKSSFVKKEGTIVQSKYIEKDMPVTGVALDTNIMKISVVSVPDIPGIAAKLFGALSREKINVDMIIQNVTREIGKKKINDISFTVAADDGKKAVEIAQKVAKEIKAEKVITSDNLCKISIVGAGMISKPGVAASMFSALAEKNINIEMISTSEIKISCLIDKKFGEVALRSLHKKFGLNKLSCRK